MDKEKLSYFALRLFTYPLRFLPLPFLHFLGRRLGSLCYYFLSEYRKRTLSNLALAKELYLSEDALIRTAKQSFQNLAINVLEYGKFFTLKDYSKVIQCENPEEALALHKKGVGIIFFCGHQANWETLFLDGTSRMRGIAIGKPTKNKHLYRWVLKIREKNGGKIIAQKNAVREGIRGLKKGTFLGILGDQGMPNSSYSYPFLGRRAYTSTAPALLSYKTNSPIIVATTRRVRGGYRIHYSDPIWPDQSKTVEEETPRLMNASLEILEDSIKRAPGDWLWQHNRYKQQTPKTVYKRFRKDCLLIILPEKNFHKVALHLETLKEIYPNNFFFLLVPEKHRKKTLIHAEKVFTYRSEKELFLKDYRFKLVFNFSGNDRIKNHYLKLSAFEVLNLRDLRELALPHLPKGLQNNASEILKRSLSRPGVLWHQEEK